MVRLFVQIQQLDRRQVAHFSIKTKRRETDCHYGSRHGTAHCRRRGGGGGGEGGGGLHRRVERQHSLASVLYQVSQRGDSVSVSDRHLVHGHRDKHLQPDCRSRRF